MIEVLFFARLREQLGTAKERLQAGSEATDVGAVIKLLQRRGGVWEEAFGDGQTVIMAVNQEVASASTPVKDGDEVAFFPPVTGG
jgi:molybdopterin synthase sulfur carrier subunit